jgi:hypothetical protein
MRKNVHTHANIIKVLDTLVLNPKMTVAARAIKVSTMTIYRWLRLSREGAPEFQQIEWCGEVGSFHQFYEYALRAQINEIEQTAKKNALGFDEVVTHDGAIQYKIDPKLVGMSDEMLADFGYPDRYLRIDGKVQPLTVKRKPSDALVIKMLSAHKPELYGERSRVDVNMRVGGVLRLQRPDEMVKTIDHQPTAASLEGEGGEEDQSAKTSTMLALGRPARSSEEFDQWNANKEFAAAPVAFVKADSTRTVTKAELPLTGDKPLTPLQADPLRRTQQPAQHPHPTVAAASTSTQPSVLAPVSKPFIRRDDQAEGIGAGRVHPGGYKVA